MFSGNFPISSLDLRLRDVKEVDKFKKEFGEAEDMLTSLNLNSLRLVKFATIRFKPQVSRVKPSFQLRLNVTKLDKKENSRGTWPMKPE